MNTTLGALAERLGVELDGDPGLQITHLASLDTAATGALTHLSSAAYRDKVADCQASAIILTPEDRPLWPGSALLTGNPYLTYARATHFFRAPLAFAAGEAESATVAATAVLHESAHVAAGAVVGPGTVLGPGVIVGPNTVVGADCVIGEGSRLHANVTLADDVHLGAGCTVHSGAVLGADGFGYTPDERGQWVEIAQLGGVRIADRVSIGANTTIDRGALGPTVIEEGVKIDNLCQIGHNTQIGAHTLICGCVGVVGSTKIGRHCVLAGGVGIGGDRPIELCDQVMVSARSLITQSITEPGTYSSGTLHTKLALWKRNALRFQQLDGMMGRLRRVEKALRANRLLADEKD